MVSGILEDRHFGEWFRSDGIPVADLRKIIVEFARSFSGVVETMELAERPYSLEIRVEKDEAKDFRFHGHHPWISSSCLIFYDIRMIAFVVCSPHSNATEFDRWLSQTPYPFSWHYCAPTGCTHSKMHSVKTLEELLEQLFYVEINKSDPTKPRYSYASVVQRYSIDTCRFQHPPGPRGQCLWYVA